MKFYCACMIWQPNKISQGSRPTFKGEFRENLGEKWYKTMPKLGATKGEPGQKNKKNIVPAAMIRSNRLK